MDIKSLALLPFLMAELFLSLDIMAGTEDYLKVWKSKKYFSYYYNLQFFDNIIFKDKRL